jgi:hypothetical protein
MRRIHPAAPLAMAMTLAFCGILAGPARADGHGHDRGRDRDRGRRHEDGDRGRRWPGTYYYGPEPDVYYAPPVVVYPPPRPPSGISFFFPFWFR